MGLELGLRIMVRDRVKDRARNWYKVMVRDYELVIGLGLALALVLGLRFLQSGSFDVPGFVGTSFDQKNRSVQCVDLQLNQGHREFPFGKLKIPLLLHKIPENSR